MVSKKTKKSSKIQLPKDRLGTGSYRGVKKYTVATYERPSSLHRAKGRKKLTDRPVSLKTARSIALKAVGRSGVGSEIRVIYSSGSGSGTVVRAYRVITAATPGGEG